VVNVASMAGYMPTAGNAAYGTTKFAVVGLSEHLRVELAHHGIGVTAVCPGMIDTSIVGAMRTRGAFDVPGFRERTTDAFRRRGYSAERVAEAIWRAVQQDRGIAPVAAEAWALYYLKRLLPGLTWKLGEAIARGVRRELARPALATTK
jgi:short-subunit dehydrogenase